MQELQITVSILIIIVIVLGILIKHFVHKIDIMERRCFLFSDEELLKQGKKMNAFEFFIKEQITLSRKANDEAGLTHWKQIQQYIGTITEYLADDELDQKLNNI